MTRALKIITVCRPLRYYYYRTKRLIKQKGWRGVINAVVVKLQMQMFYSTNALWHKRDLTKYSEKIDSQKVKSKLTDGVLEIVLTKSKPTPLQKKRSIKIQ